MALVGNVKGSPSIDLRDGGGKLIAFALAALFFLAYLLAGAPAAQATEEKDEPAPETEVDFTSDKCGVEVVPSDPPPRQVNLMLDDSGSMFADQSGAIDRWSNAKYSLEVFAAMLGPQDLLNVYRTSDFTQGKTSGPATQVKGSEPIEARIAQIHNLPMIGGGTPYAPVAAAVENLQQSDFTEKWLVVVSDGAFEGVEDSQVQADLERYSAENSTDESSFKVAFLAIGDEAPNLTSNPGAGLYYAEAEKTAELLAVMTAFSNRIFARSELEGSEIKAGEWQISPDLELKELLVFAQGADVEVTDLVSGSEVFHPSSVAQVSWVENEASELRAVPNKDLMGKLATFEDLPAGEATLGISGAQVVSFFYQPRVAFGMVITDDEGNVVDSDKIVGGDYSLSFGFMDESCDFIESPLLGEVTYHAQVFQDGELVADELSPGDPVHLERGEARIEVMATYLNDNTARAVVDVGVLRPAQPTIFEVEQRPFVASELNDYSMPQDAMVVRYGQEQEGALAPFSEEEWASFTPESFVVSSPKNLEFEVALGDTPGTVYVLPVAPGGEPMDAATGDVPITITASHIYDEQLSEGSLETTVTVEDDFSFWQKMMHWMKTQGWKWLLGLLLLIIIYGYISRPRLPKKLKKSPLISFRPKNPTARRTQSNGKVTKSAFAKFVPFKADTAQIRYVPAGIAGFRTLRVKAVRGGRMKVLNWKSVAAAQNVEFDGEPLNKETRKARNLGGASVITATDSTGIYDCHLGDSKQNKRA